MATQSEPMDVGQEGEPRHPPDRSYERQDQLENCQPESLSPSHQTAEKEELAREIRPFGLPHDASGLSRHKPSAFNVDIPPLDTRPDGSSANTLAYGTHRQPLGSLVGQTVRNLIEQPLNDATGPAVTVTSHQVDAHDQGSAIKRNFAQPTNIEDSPHEDDAQGDTRTTRILVSSVEGVQCDQQSTRSHEQQLKQKVAPTAKRKVRKLRKKRLIVSVAAQPETVSHEASVVLNTGVTNNCNTLYPVATHGHLAEPGVIGGSCTNQQHEPPRLILPDSPHFQMEKKMKAAATGGGRYYHAGHNLPNDPRVDDKFERYDQHELPVMHNQYFQPHQEQYDAPNMSPEQIEAMQPAQCPSSDIVGDAAQEFEHRIYRKQQAKSAKHQAERNAWQKDFEREIQAKQTLQDRLGSLQQEKDDLAVAIEKQKMKIASFETMANKLKTFVGGLANDMGALKRDASTHRQNCSDIGIETKEHKAVLEVLIQQLSGNAEKSSQLKNEAIKACHSARSELSAATVRADHLEEQLKEKSVLLAEEKNVREQILNRLAYVEKHCQDSTIRLIKSSEQSILDKLSEIAISLPETLNGEDLIEPLEKAFTAVQGLSSRQTATCNDVASVKRIVERLSESLTKHNDDTQHQTDHASLVEIQINEALKCLKSDLCQQEKLTVQDATNRGIISGLESRLDEVKARMSDCDTKLATSQSYEYQLKEQNRTLQAKIETLKMQIPSEKTTKEHNQLRTELSLKVIALENAKSELDTKVSELHKLSTTNGELQTQVDDLALQLGEAPSVASFQAQRMMLEEKHREETESAKGVATDLMTEFRENEMSEAANALKRMTADRDKISRKLATLADDLESSRKQLETLHKQHASNVSAMQKEIDLIENIAADRSKKIDALKSDLETVQKTTDQAESMSTELSAEKEALRKVVEEKNLLVEQMGQFCRAREDGEEELKQNLRQCRIDSEETEKRLKAEVHAVRVRGTEVNQQMQDSTEAAIQAEKAKYEKQLQALQKSLQDSHTDLESRIKTDEEFREALQRSWQSEEKEHQAKVTELNGRILEAEMHRDEAVADNERLREELAKAHSSTISTADVASFRTSAQPPKVAVPNDPRLQDRHSQTEDGPIPRDTTNISQHSVIEQVSDQAVKKVTYSTATRKTHEIKSLAATHGPVVEESQLTPYHAISYPHSQKDLSQRRHISQSRALRGSVVNESQQHFSAFSQIHEDDRPSGVSCSSNQAHGPIVKESQQQSNCTFDPLQSGMSPLRVPLSGQDHQDPSTLQNSNTLTSPTILVQSTHRARESNLAPRLDDVRGPIVEETQQSSFRSSRHSNHFDEGLLWQHQSSHTVKDANIQSRNRSDAETETQFLPETKHKLDTQVGNALFENFNAKKGKNHNLLSGAFENTPTRAGAQGLRNVPPRFQKQVPSSNTGTKMVRPGTGSSSLSSLPEEGSIPSSSAGATEIISRKAARYKTPEPRSLRDKPRPMQSTPSISSPGFVEQMEKGRSQNTYHAGESGNNTGRHHSDHKEPRAVAPKRKAQSQVVGGYEQERKKKQANRSSQGDGHSLSELVASQNRGIRAPSSSRATPRAANQQSRMQTFAGASATSTRQTRNTARRLSRDEQINARLARELNAAR